MRNKSVAWFGVLALAISLRVYAGVGDSSSNSNPAAVVQLGAPEWFTNIRDERLARATAWVTNCSERPLWCITYFKRDIWYDYERRSSGSGTWERVNVFHDGTHSAALELPPGASRKILVNATREVGKDIRLLLRLYRVAKNYPGQKWLPRLEDPLDVMSNAVEVGPDPGATQQRGAADRSQSLSNPK